MAGLPCKSAALSAPVVQKHLLCAGLGTVALQKCCTAALLLQAGKFCLGLDRVALSKCCIVGCFGLKIGFAWALARLPCESAVLSILWSKNIGFA